MGGKRLHYISDLVRHGAQLEVRCTNCDHAHLFEPGELRARVGDADPWLIPFRCSQCESDKTRIFAIVPERPTRKFF